MYYLYADDTQLCVSFKLGSDDHLSSVKSRIEMCTGNQQLDDS